MPDPLKRITELQAEIARLIQERRKGPGASAAAFAEWQAGDRAIMAARRELRQLRWNVKIGKAGGPYAAGYRPRNPPD